MATKKNNRNPYNPESLLYKGLTRLLSGPLTDHDRQNPRQLKRNQLDKYASKFSKASLQPFRKSANNPLSNQMASFKTNQNRNERYLDFEQMEFYPLINSALDIYADEMTTSSPLSKLLTINCPNEEIKSILEHLYYEVLNIEHNIFGWCRTLCKYGDFFAYLDLEKDIGIKGIIGLPAHEIEIMEGQDKLNPNYVQYQWNSAAQTLENWQIAHFRILGNDKYNPYGTSVIEAARRIWRQLNLQEDAMMAYRVVRCLHGESKVWTKNGFKNIKDIKIGDSVYSYDRENKLILSKVTDWIDNGPQKIWKVRSKNCLLKANFNHPILTRDKTTNTMNYVEVCNLDIQRHQLIRVLECKDSLCENILEVVETDEISNVYDIRVDNENHNFIADGCVVHNSPERRAFYIDIGGIPEKDAEQYVQRIITETKKSQIIDPDTGRVDLRYNPQSVDEDFYIPVVGNNSGTRIESLPGGQYTGDIDDVKYLRENLMSALKIPQSYLVSADGAEDKTTLAQKDIQFARTIQRLQRSVASELQKIGIVHLYILGYRGKDLLNFKLHMNNPSKIYELQELEHWNTKFDVASAATEGFFSKRWIAKKIFNLSDEEFLRNLRETFYDAEYEAELENLVASKTEPGGEGMEGDLGGDLGGAGEIPAGEETAEPEAEEESDSMLLASPPVGKRHDKMTTTIRSKGKLYKPVEVDKRDIGARRRHHKSQYADQFARNTFRNVWKGASGMKTAANGIYEDIEAIYRESINEDLNRETEILENDKSIKIMIENLSKNFKKDGDNS